MSRPILKEHSDDHPAKNLDVFFKNPEFEENKHGCFESPGLRRLRLRQEDKVAEFNFERIANTLADEVRQDDDESGDVHDVVRVKKVPEIFQSDEYKKKMLTEEENYGAPKDPASIQPRLYCYYDEKVGAATVGASDVVPPGTKKLNSFHYGNVG
jgi:hypothetical protein